MKSLKIIALSLITSITLCGCSNTVEKISELYKYFSEKKEIEVHTQEEMEAYALSSLKDRYGKEFAIDHDTFCKYGHFNGHEDKEMVLRARAYPVDAPEDYCGIYVKEPNYFSENYYVYQFKDEIGQKIYPAMQEYGLDNDFYIDATLKTLPVAPDMTADELLYDPDTTINFKVYMPKEEDYSVYFPVIRQWAEFLYSDSVDYDWYFSINSEDDPLLSYFSMYKGEHSYTSADQWTDEDFIDGFEDWEILNDD